MKSMAATAAALDAFTAYSSETVVAASGIGLSAASSISVDGHTKLASFSRNGETWTVYEDLQIRDGVITFVPWHSAHPAEDR